MFLARKTRSPDARRCDGTGSPRGSRTRLPAADIAAGTVTSAVRVHASVLKTSIAPGTAAPGAPAGAPAAAARRARVLRSASRA